MFDYRKFAPIGQTYEMTCWAACLSWWLKAMGNGRPPWTQAELIEKFADVMVPSGGLVVGKLIERLNTTPGLKIRAGTAASAPCRGTRLPSGEAPALVIYRPPENSGSAPNSFHMNVVVAQANQTVTTMEPYFPVPCEDFARTGAFLTRPLAFFLESPDLMIASPSG